MTALLLSLISIAIGPLFFSTLRQRKAIYGLLDGFVLIGVAGLVLVEVLPRAFESVSTGKWLVLLLASVGFILPLFLEKRLSILPFSPGNFFQGLMIVGLFFHQLLDGMALHNPSHGHGHDHSQGPFSFHLQIAIVLHQLPKGFLLWSVLRGKNGDNLARLLIIGLAGMTVAGYFLASTLNDLLHNQTVWLFQSFVAGGLLHVIMHHVPGEKTGLAQKGMAFWSGLGAMVSLGALLSLHFFESTAGHGESMAEQHSGGVSNAFMHLFLESAPSILLGLCAAGVVHAFLPNLVAKWFHGKGRFSQTLRGIAIGIPLPICSCGVAPVYLGLMRKGVPTAAAIAFLIATPEIGLESVFLSWRLLGLKITLIRLALAFLVAMTVGLTISKFIEMRGKTNVLDQPQIPEDDSVDKEQGKFIRAIRFGGGEIVDEIGIWLLAGISIAALLQPLTTPKWLTEIPEGMEILLFSVIGLPVYVCASGATPLASVLLQKGISVGAVLVLLINGPATNVTTFGTVKRVHGVVSALVFALAILVSSIVFGFAVNLLFPEVSAPILSLHEKSFNWIDWAAALVLVGLFASSIVRKGPRGFLAPLGALSTGGAMTSGEGGDGHSHSHGHDHCHP